ncbi:MAG: PA domain-containing protein [Acidobacteriota bacterium]
MTTKLRHALLLLAALSLLAAPAAFGATVTIVNVDPPNVGFNDPTPAAPVGGNPGTTLGQQRLNAFQYAAGLWGATLDSPITIRVQASNPPLPCNATSAVLGAAGTIQVFANFANAPFTNTWYPGALANKLAGVDLAPGAPGTNADDIVAQFNRSIDNNPNCLAGTNWYYGLDHNNGNDIDYVTVVTHEIGHGVGFASFTNESTGQFVGPPFLPSVFDRFTFDNDQGLFWDQMTNAQRVASAINCCGVVWDGPQVNMFAPFILDSGAPGLRVTAPAGIAGTYAVGTASFGPPLASPGVSGTVELVNDGVGTTTDGCEALVGFTAGNIALIDRGSCAFTVKAQNAEAAGAVGVVIADNVAGCPPPGLAGTDPGLTIPSVRISLDDGNTIKANLPGVVANLGVAGDQLAGADDDGNVKLFSPDPVQPGSSISHWDTSATPNLLMEPFISADLDDDLDLTPMALADMGWMLLQTCGNNTREGLEKCDGTDLFGQTCRSLGFDGGTLACSATCDAFDTNACFTCEDGKSEGSWNEPNGLSFGSAGGYLYDSSGAIAYKIVLTLSPTGPNTGIVAGIIYDGNAPDPDFWVSGGYRLNGTSGGVDFGTWGAKIIPFGGTSAVGKISGDWKDRPSLSSIGRFAAKWEICQ